MNGHQILVGNNTDLVNEVIPLDNLTEVEALSGEK